MDGLDEVWMYDYSFAICRLSRWAADLLAATATARTSHTLNRGTTVGVPDSKVFR